MLQEDSKRYTGSWHKDDRIQSILERHIEATTVSDADVDTNKKGKAAKDDIVGHRSTDEARRTRSSILRRWHKHSNKI